MKKSLCIFLALSIVLLISGCKDKDTPILEPVNFYYRNFEISYNAADGLISPVVVESAGYNGNALELLNFYLKGPEDSHHAHTFPSGTQVLKLEFVGANAQIQLTNDFARLSGIDLTVSCAALSMTVMELTGATSVTITTASTTMDGNQSITMDMQSILLFDSSYTNE